MPKLKTHKGAKKRFRITGKKKILHSKAYKNHILTKKSAKRKRGLSRQDAVSPSERSRIKDMLPYEF